jgi:hypothetical protein
MRAGAGNGEAHSDDDGVERKSRPQQARNVRKAVVSLAVTCLLQARYGVSGLCVTRGKPCSSPLFPYATQPFSFQCCHHSIFVSI